jgi:hypothetical protein
VASADNTSSYWSGACTGSVGPGTRNCTSSLDNDCDGKPDNTADAICQCTSPTANRACETHTQDGTGICKAGSQPCVISSDKATASWGACSGSVGPGARNCTSSADNDCNGSPDNTIDATCACASGASRGCNTHPGKDGNGPCKAGSQSCQVAADQKSSAWGTCSGDVGPAAADTCDPGNDANCNGVKNEGCGCVNGATQHCGNCGTQTCAGGTYTGTSCLGQCKQPAPNCNGSYACVCGASVVCGACLDWDFEDNTLGNWSFDPNTFPPATIALSTARATPGGTHSMAIQITQPTYGLQLRVRVPFCSAGASLAGHNLHFKVMAVTAPGSQQTTVNARANPLAWTSDATSNGSPAYDPTVDQYLTEGTWTSVDGYGVGSDTSAYVFAGFFINVYATDPSIPWQGTFYIDDFTITEP